MLHDGLNTFAMNEERSQVMLSMMENQRGTNFINQSSERSTEFLQSMDPTTNDTTIKKSTAMKRQSSIRQSSPYTMGSERATEIGINKEMADLNKKAWRPWWKSYLERCEQFIVAAKKGDFEKVAKMINIDYAQDQAVNVNFQEGGTGYSALHYAVLNNDKRLANLLVKNYVDVRVQDSNLQNPVHLACIKGNAELFKELINACYQSKESIDKYKKTPLDYARENGNIEMIEYAKKTTNMLFNIEQNQK